MAEQEGMTTLQLDFISRRKQGRPEIHILHILDKKTSSTDDLDHQKIAMKPHGNGFTVYNYTGQCLRQSVEKL